jgi:ubiquinone/menaquinone biosynthesis C-methylase UbiE
MNNKQLKENTFWNSFANHYDFFIKIMFCKTYKKILFLLNSELKSKQKILDIGTGTGIIPFSICQKVKSVVATDISPEMIKIAKQKQVSSGIENIDFQVQDAYNLPFPDKSFDVVIAANLLHLLFEPEKPISEAKRVLKDNGIFIAPTLCAGENFRSKAMANISAMAGIRFVNKWSINEFEAMLKSNGLIIFKTIKINGRFPLAYSVTSKC